LVSLTGTDTPTNRDDATAWANQGKDVTVVNLTEKGFKDEDVLASGRRVDAALGTLDNPGPTKYKLIPTGALGNANSNSAAMAVVNGAQTDKTKPVSRPKRVRAIGDEESDRVGTGKVVIPKEPGMATKSILSSQGWVAMSLIDNGGLSEFTNANHELDCLFLNDSFGLC
jgi:hypothetical protein